MIDDLRPGQVVEFEYDRLDRGSYRHDGALRRYRVVDVNGAHGVALVARHDPSFEVIPIEVVKKHMDVVEEPSPPAVLPENMTKDDVFEAVFDFINHERDCDECGGEVEIGGLSQRLRYLCDKGRSILAWWGTRP